MNDMIHKSTEELREIADDSVYADKRIDARRELERRGEEV